MTAKRDYDENMYQHFMEKWGLNKKPTTTTDYVPLEEEEVGCFKEDSIPNYQQQDYSNTEATAAPSSTYDGAWQHYRQQLKKRASEDEQLRSQYWAYFSQAPQYGKLNDDALPTIDDLSPESCYCRKKKKRKLERDSLFSTHSCPYENAAADNIDNPAAPMENCRERHWAAQKLSYFEWWKHCRIARLYAAEERKARRQFVRDMTVAIDSAKLRKTAMERQRQE